LLSLSASPAVGPCGIPFEPDPDVVAEPPPDDELEVWVDGLEDGVDELPLEELEPQAERPKAASTSNTAARRRVDLVTMMSIISSVLRSAGTAHWDLDACADPVVPARYRVAIGKESSPQASFVPDTPVT
jgi:hypothetical protein